MWWFDPGKGLLNALVNRVLTPYVENLDMEKVTYGISEGQLILKQLQLKKRALNELDLPIQIIEGHLATFTLSFHWKNIGSQPVDILIENAYIVIAPLSLTSVEKSQIPKAEMIRRKLPLIDTSSQPAGFWTSLTANMLKNLQITIKHIHIRYVDLKMERFSAGILLDGFTISSVNGNWAQASMEIAHGITHKLAKLSSLAVYFDISRMETSIASNCTYNPSIPPNNSDSLPPHQLVLKPVSGEGTIVLSRRAANQVPHYDIQLLFDEISATLTDDQTGMVLSLVNEYQLHLRRRKYIQFWPNVPSSNHPRARWRFAMAAVLHTIHEQRKTWSWDYFAERRNFRKSYMQLFQKKLLSTTVDVDLQQLDKLEARLSSKDIMTYRSIVRSHLRQDDKVSKSIGDDKTNSITESRGWLNWIWNSDQRDQREGFSFGGTSTKEQRRRPFDAIEQAEESTQSDGHSLRAVADLRVAIKVNQGLLALKKSVQKTPIGIMSVVFDTFLAEFVGRTTNYDASLSLGDLRVFDDNTKDSLYRQIVRVNQKNASSMAPREPFLYVKFERNPRNRLADRALLVRLLRAEFIYHRGYVEAIKDFFKSPSSQVGSIESILNETATGLSTAIQIYKTTDIDINLDAPTIIVPENVVTEHTYFLVVDAGHICIFSDALNKDKSSMDEHRTRLLKYNKTILRLTAAQAIIGTDLSTCRETLVSQRSSPLRILECNHLDLHILTSNTFNSDDNVDINLFGRLPVLQFTLSDTKYNAILRILRLSLLDRLVDSDRERHAAETLPEHSLLCHTSWGFPGLSEGHNHAMFDHSAIHGSRLLHNNDEHMHRQRSFNFGFQVDTLRILLHKCNECGVDEMLGDISMEQFAVSTSLRDQGSTIKLNLRSFVVNLSGDGHIPLQFIKSTTSSHRGLTMSYYHRQSKPHDHSSMGCRVNKNIDITISALTFEIAERSVLSMYNFILAILVSDSDMRQTDSSSSTLTPAGKIQTLNADGLGNNNTRLSLKLVEFHILLVTEARHLVTCSSSTANFTLIIRRDMTCIAGRLGHLEIDDASPFGFVDRESRLLLHTEGQTFADFGYQVGHSPQPGMWSSFHLNSGSMEIYFLVEPLRDIIKFVATTLSTHPLYHNTNQKPRWKGLAQHLQWDIALQPPSIIFPLQASQRGDICIVRLGKICSKTCWDVTVEETVVSVQGMHLMLKISNHSSLSHHKIMEDLDFNLDIRWLTDMSSHRFGTSASLEVAIKFSNVKMFLTGKRQCVLLQVVQMIIAAASWIPYDVRRIDGETDVGVVCDRNVNNKRIVDLKGTIISIDIHFCNSQKGDYGLEDSHTILFSLNDNIARFTSKFDGTTEVQLVVKAFTVKCPKSSHRDLHTIIHYAPSNENHDHIVLLYTTSSDPATSLLFITVGRTRIIANVDDILHCLESLTVGMPTCYFPPISTSDIASQRCIKYRIDFHDAVVALPSNNQDTDAQVLEFGIRQLTIINQDIVTVIVRRLGISLLETNPSQGFILLEQVDFMLTYRDRGTVKRMAGLNLIVRPVIIRLSYHRSSVIHSILSNIVIKWKKIQVALDRASDLLVPFIGHKSIQTRCLLQEELQVRFDEVRIAMSGNIEKTTLLRLSVKTFYFTAADWSSKLQGSGALSLEVNYWNVSNSYWEPLIDPWVFTMSIAKGGRFNALKASMCAQERLDINVTPAFVEMALLMLCMSQQTELLLRRPQVHHASYCICNRTGITILVWSDDNNKHSRKDIETAVIGSDDEISWSFDDCAPGPENGFSPGRQTICIHFTGKPWESLRGIPVNREGHYAYPLKLRFKNSTQCLLCSISVRDSVKLITLRSTHLVENETLYPLELLLVDAAGNFLRCKKLAPGQDFSLPIDIPPNTKLRLQPDKGFGYKWGPPLESEDLMPQSHFTIRCPHHDKHEAWFRFQALVEGIGHHRITNLKLRAPIELENLLPYDIIYRINNKNTDQSWAGSLPQGGMIPIHSVELDHLILLNVVVKGTVFTASDFAIINTDKPSHFDVERCLVLHDQCNRRLELKLNYVHDAETGGAFKVQIYAAYILINNTKLPFAVKSTRFGRRAPLQDVAGDIRPDYLSKPFPFMMSHPLHTCHAFRIKIGESVWSEAISIDVPTAETELVIPSERRRGEKLHFGLSWTLGKYKLTKVITIVPRFTIRNNFSEPICFREHGVYTTGRAIIDAGHSSPLFSTQARQGNLVTIAFPGLNTRWSPPINIEDIGSVHFPLEKSAAHLNKEIVEAHVQLNGSAICITFSPTEIWPFIIENDSDHSVSIWQTGLGQCNSIPEGRELSYRIGPRSHLGYAWDYPSARGKRITLHVKDAYYTVDIMEIGVLPPFVFIDTLALSLDVRADGNQQILRITNYIAENHLYQPKSSFCSRLDRPEESGQGEVFEAVTDDTPPFFSFDIRLAGIGLSLSNRKMVEILYATIDNFDLEYSTSRIAQALDVSWRHIQIDNQLHEALYPVVLKPTPICDESNKIVPTVQGSILWLKDREHGVLFIKYCSILIQALTVELDEDLLFAIFDAMQTKGMIWQEDKEDSLTQVMDGPPEQQTKGAAQILYFEVLELQPMQLSLSFELTKGIYNGDKPRIRSPFTMMINALTMALGSINEAPLQLNALAIKDMRLTLPELRTRIIYHYRQDILRQFYLILGSADIFGNPVGLFTNVSSGVADIFYAPYHGAVMYGNEKLGVGIAKGAASFVKKTVFGLADSVTKFTNSVGKGLSIATFDDQYSTHRRVSRRRNKPRHAIYGFSAGGEALASSIMSAVEGIVTKPLHGAEVEGTRGFLKGLGKGIVGAVTKPAIGVFDLASSVSEGIRNTTTAFDAPHRQRVRLPRHISADGILVPYSAHGAAGQFWMRNLRAGAYRNESYVAHMDLPDDDNIVLLTTSTILSFRSRKLQLNWELPLSAVQELSLEDTGIRFKHKRGDSEDKFVFILDKRVQWGFLESVTSVVQFFNELQGREV